MKDTTIAQTVQALRESFDAGFAAPLLDEREELVDLIAVRAGAREVVLRAAEVAAVMRCPALTAMPSDNEALCGLAAVRGALVAVYSLEMLLEPGASTPGLGGWMVLCGGDRSAGLQFDDLTGYSRLPKSRIHQAQSVARDGIATQEVVEWDDAHRALVRVPLLLETIRQAAQAGDFKE